jgi:Protein of unknown function (DUF2637)
MAPTLQAPTIARRDRFTLALAEGAIVVGTALGFVLSYSALRHLAERHGYEPWEAALWPLAVDFVAVACTALAMALAKRRSGPTGETWTLAAAAALVSLSGNVLSAWGDPVAASMHAWAAAIYVGLWHAFFRTLQTGEPVSAAERSPEPLVEPQVEHPAIPEPERLPEWPAVALVETPRPRAPKRRTSDPRARVRALVEAANARGERVSGADVARAIGRSPQRGRALLAEVLAETPTRNGAGHGAALQ